MKRRDGNKACMKDSRNAGRILYGYLKGRDSLGDLRIYVKAIL
jgi:hypothetical protein